MLNLLKKNEITWIKVLKQRKTYCSTIVALICFRAFFRVARTYFIYHYNIQKFVKKENILIFYFHEPKDFQVKESNFSSVQFSL